MRKLLPLLLFLSTCTAWASQVHITTASLPNGTVGVAYPGAVSATGGCTPYVWSTSGTLPLGLTSSPSTDSRTLYLKGTPTQAAAYSFSVNVKGCGSHLNTKSYTVTIQASASAPLATIQPPSLSFGGSTVGSPSLPQPVTLQNTGTAPLNLTSIASSANYTQSNNCVSPLAVGLLCTVNVIFDPSVSGTLNGTLTFLDNAGTGTQAVSLTGVGQTVQHLVTLTWGASSSSNISGYNVFRGTGAGGPYTQVNTGGLVPALTYSDGTVASGQSYYYVVTAVDISNNASGYSNEAPAMIPFP